MNGTQYSELDLFLGIGECAEEIKNVNNRLDFYREIPAAEKFITNGSGGKQRTGHRALRYLFEIYKLVNPNYPQIFEDTNRIINAEEMWEAIKYRGAAVDFLEQQGFKDSKTIREIHEIFEHDYDGRILSSYPIDPAIILYSGIVVLPSPIPRRTVMFRNVTYEVLAIDGESPELDNILIESIWKFFKEKEIEELALLEKLRAEQEHSFGTYYALCDISEIELKELKDEKQTLSTKLDEYRESFVSLYISDTKTKIRRLEESTILYSNDMRNALSVISEEEPETPAVELLLKMTKLRPKNGTNVDEAYRYLQRHLKPEEIINFEANLELARLYNRLREEKVTAEGRFGLKQFDGFPEIEKNVKEIDGLIRQIDAEIEETLSKIHILKKLGKMYKLPSYFEAG